MTPEKSAIEALRLMWDGGFRHIPVVDCGRLVGVVSRGDFKGTERDRLDEERDLWEHMR
jgi:CBS-domain-containing membrane protein